MKQNALALALALVLGLAACSSSGENASEQAAPAPVPATSEGAADVAPAVLPTAQEMPDGSAVAGAPLGVEVSAVSLADALAHPEQFDGQLVRLTGTIREVCQTKGCWMIVTDGVNESRVTFADYGFFVPKDAAGRVVEMDARLERTTMSVEDAKHLASETEGQDPDAITAPVEVVSVVATGVRILPATSGE